MTEDPAGHPLARPHDEALEGVRSEPHSRGESHRATPGEEPDRPAVRAEELADSVGHAGEHGPEVERGGQRLRDAGERLGRLLAPPGLGEQPGVLEREGRVGGQGLQELPVLGGEAEADRVVDREDPEHAVGGQQRDGRDRAEVQGLDPGPGLRRELDLGIPAGCPGSPPSGAPAPPVRPRPRRGRSRGTARRARSLGRSRRRSPSSRNRPNASAPRISRHFSAMRSRIRSASRVDGEELAHLRGGLHPLRARRGQAQQARVLERDRRLDGEIGEGREVGLRERARGHVAGDDDHAPERAAGHQRLGHEGAVDVAEPRQRQRRVREVVDDHPLAASRRHADDALAHRDGHALHPLRPVEGRVRAQDLPGLVQQIDAAGVGVEQLGGAAADRGHEGVHVALAGDLSLDLAQRLEPPQAARGDLEERRAFDGDRRVRAERAEEVDLERREVVRLPREDAERAEHAIAAREPDAGERADALVARPRPIERRARRRRRTARPRAPRSARPRPGGLRPWA